jgi:hypothetical protein
MLVAAVAVVVFGLETHQKRLKQITAEEVRSFAHV